MTADEDPRAAWLAIVAEADRAPDGRHAGMVEATIRRVVGAVGRESVVPLVIGDPRTAAELSAAYLREWRRADRAGAA